MSLKIDLKNSPHFIEKAWDYFCLLSLIGIWPRFIEPNLLTTTEHILPIENLPKELSGLSILHLSDLHFSQNSSDKFLRRIIKKAKALQPHLILFTGDIISYASLEEKERLKAFLSSLDAPLGCFLSWGNHDYSQYVSLNDNQEICIIKDHVPPLLSGIYRLLSSKKHSYEKPLQNTVKEHKELKELIEESNWTILHNKTVQVGTGRSSKINLTGLGDYMAHQCRPEEAFTNQDTRFPTVVLSHNPDTLDLLDPYACDLILSGHTHGGQVNLPFIWKRITPVIHTERKSGLLRYGNRFLYVNRGIGAVIPFRFFAMPEMAKITLVPAKEAKIRLPLFEEQYIKSKNRSPLFTCKNTNSP